MNPNHTEPKLPMITSHTGLRGIAALAVFFTHLGHEKQITKGITAEYFSMFYWADFAVDLFFILSGFILCWVYFRNENQKISWSKYLKARCARILPLYYLTLCPYLPPIIGTFRYHGYFYEHGKELFLLFINVFLISGFAGVTRWDWTLNAPAWSISIEFLAYLVLFPALVFLFLKYREKAFFYLMVVTSLGMVFCYAAVNHELMGWDWGRLGRGVFGFPLGFVICMLFKRTEVKSDLAVDAVSLIAVIILFLALYSILPRILALCVLPFVVYFTAFNRGYFCRFLNIPANQWLGERSYSIYLWHIPIMYVYFIPKIGTIDSLLGVARSYQGVMNIIIVIVSVFIISELSYRYFESPLRRILRRDLSRVRV